MMWVCPTCKRIFRNTNQQHSCIITDPKTHFHGRPEELHSCYNLIIGFVSSLGKIQVSPVKNAILVSAKSTFLALKVKKDRLDIEFLLTEEADEFPVSKTVRVSKNRVAHFITVSDPGDIDDHLLGLLSRSYHVNIL